jgi:hypothetical protein
MHASAGWLPTAPHVRWGSPSSAAPRTPPPPLARLPALARLLPAACPLPPQSHPLPPVSRPPPRHPPVPLPHPASCQHGDWRKKPWEARAYEELSAYYISDDVPEEVGGGGGFVVSRWPEAG